MMKTTAATSVPTPAETLAAIASPDAVESPFGTLTFLTTQLTTVLSDPTKNTRWFSGITVNPSFPHPTTFLGDYSGISSLNGTATLWTDMRNNVSFAGRSGAGEDAFYAAAP